MEREPGVSRAISIYSARSESDVRHSRTSGGSLSNLRCHSIPRQRGTLRLSPLFSRDQVNTSTDVQKRIIARLHALHPRNRVEDDAFLFLQAFFAAECL